ncbi:MAG TPA: tetratricopeptide repeat protein [Polyangiaceae bacterium]|jgi:tetratricopeptide (TPR) repeat protein
MKTKTPLPHLCFTLPALAAIALAPACSKRAEGPPMVKDTAQITAATVAAPPANALAVEAPAAATEPARGFQKSYDEEASGHIEAALAALNDAPAASSNAAYVAELRRGWLLYRLGKNPESVASYRKSIGLAPASIEAKVGLLAPLAALRRWNDVETAAREVLRKDAASYQGTIRLAFALYSQARFADAAGYYRALLQAYPSDVDAGAGLGWSLLKEGKKDEAAATFARVLEIAPHNALAGDGARAASQP